MHKSHGIWMLVGFLLVPGWGRLVAQEFRVETEVYADDKKEPVAESLTIFAGEVVYDFLFGGSDEITMFDARRGRIVLLDPQRKMQTTLTTENLLEFCAAIKTRAAGEDQEALFSPRFEASFDQERGRLTLTSERIIYRAKGVAPKQPEAVERFQQFADWYARLNAVRPGNLPPFGRIELNKALAEHQLIPEEIERTIVIKRPVADRKLSARSHHVITWLISTTDRKRIETVGNYLSRFPEVSGREFWQPSVAARDSK